MTTSEKTFQNIDSPKPVSKSPSRPAQVRKLLRRKSGVSIAQLQQAFGWQPHTARAAISAQRKAGHVVDRTETAKGSVYRIVGESGDQ